MSAAKHTPGPWRPARSRDYGWLVNAATGCVALARSGSVEARDDATEANARLIAAAPDLLAALKEATRCLAWHEERHGVAMDRKAVEDARAIIARVEP